MNNIILFDGICNFCHWNVQFIIKRDPKAIYKFASLQSDIGQQLLEQFGINNDTKSLILIENNQFYDQSTAALKICKNLSSFWKLLYICIIIPKRLRDFIYTIIANNRYKWFGIKDSCKLPSSTDIKERFL